MISGLSQEYFSHMHRSHSRSMAPEWQCRLKFEPVYGAQDSSYDEITSSRIFTYSRTSSSTRQSARYVSSVWTDG